MGGKLALQSHEVCFALGELEGEGSWVWSEFPNMTWYWEDFVGSLWSHNYVPNVISGNTKIYYTFDVGP